MKTLFLDIETAPNVAYVWGLFKVYIPIDAIINSGYVLSWAAKWADEKEIMFDSVHKSGRKKMLKNIAKLLNEAEVVVHYNGKKFDIPTLNKEFVTHNIEPPAPYKQVDLYQVVRRQFRFASGKLDYVVQQLGLGQKVRHPGFEMWIGCMEKDPVAWKHMEKYNRQDVLILERLYGKLLPWIPNHPNHAAFEEGLVCPRCGSKKYIGRGYAVANINKYHRYQCKDCGGWFRGNNPVAVKRGQRFVPIG